MTLYKTIEALLASEKQPELYDFKNESPCEAVRDEKHPIKKVIRYRLDPSGFDCDSSNKTCKLATDMYHLLDWKKENPNWNGDTMSSFWITYRDACNLYDKQMKSDFWEENFNQYCKKYENDIYEKARKETNEDLKNELWKIVKIVRYKWVLLDETFEHYKEINEHDEIKKFATLTHAVGNFSLVSPGDNTARAFNRGIIDYWDLSLEYWKKERGEVWIEEMKKRYLLEVYFKEYSNEVFIFEGHRLGRPTFKSLNILLKFVEQINERIIDRGKRLFIELRMRTQNGKN